MTTETGTRAAAGHPGEAPLHVKLGLTDDEYARIQEVLGREPNRAELGMYSLMWSEHCSYKSSRVHLKGLPTDGPQVLQGPGENAGVVDLGDGLAAVFKIESHNHPSFVEPFQGAATGVGGIIRDILTMGARPLASLDSLRFGDLRDPQQRRLLEGVVAGVGHYGNCVGVATVGGELVLDPCYAGNPLVNVLTLGVMPADRLVLGRAERPDDAVLLLGARTGRDGIGGASVLASATFAEGQQAKRPNVQVGDPFQEKLLIEACLELVNQGLLTGLQDLNGVPEGSRASRGESLSRDMLNEGTLGRVRALNEIAKRRGQTLAQLAQVAIAWTRARSRAVHPIVGARTAEQLEDNLGAVDVTLPDAAVRRLTAAVGFEPGFPGDFINETEEWAYGEEGVTLDGRR